MNIVSFGAAAFGGLVAIWLLGGLVARIGGLLLMAAGSLGLGLRHDGNGLLVAAMGAVLWLAGHGHYALRHGAWKSPLASWVWESVGAMLGRLLAAARSRLAPSLHSSRSPSNGIRVEGGDDEYRA